MSGSPTPTASPPPGGGARTDQEGSVLVWLPALLVVATLVAVVVIDLGGHLVAVSRAATIADSAALAAVSADASSRTEAPRRAAGRVADAAGGRLELCDCAAGSRRARVRVGVEVPGLVWPRLGVARHTAEAEAVLHRPGHPGHDGRAVGPRGATVPVATPPAG